MLIGDYQHAGIELSDSAVQRRQLLARLRPPHDDLSAADIPIVKRVHRLSVFQHDIVCDINNVVDRTDAHGAQAFPHPFGRRGNFDIPDHAGSIAGAQFRIRRLHIQKFRQAAAAAA